MDDREFFDTLYQLWSKTSWAKNRYWSYESDSEAGYVVNAVDEDGTAAFVASFYKDEDADFITAIHGCLPDLVRRLHSALDEADSADYSRDSRECRIAELELELDELKSYLEKEMGWRER